MSPPTIPPAAMLAVDQGEAWSLAQLHTAGAAVPADTVNPLRILVMSHEEVPSDGATASTGNNSG